MFSLANVSLAVDSFGVWLQRTNQLLHALRTNIVTVDLTATGNGSSGNGYIIGTFASDTLVANGTLRGGTVSQAANLNVSSNTVLQSNLDVIGRMLVNNTAVVNGAATFNNTVTITGVANFNGGTNTGLIVVGANVVINPTFISIGNPAVNTRITNTAIDTDGTLAVLGATTLSNTLGTTGATTLSNTLAVTGATTLSNTLAVTGATTLSGHLQGTTINGSTVNASAAVQVGANVVINPAFISVGNPTVNTRITNTSIDTSGTLNVTGATTLSGHLQGTTINGSTINASAAVQVGANVVINPAFISIGNPTVNTRITNTAIDTDGTLAVLGATTLSNTLGVTGATTLSNTLGVTGATTLSNTLAVTGATTLSGHLQGTTINGSTVNATTIQVGANVVVDSTFISIGNPTVNTRITNTAIDTDGTLAVLGATTLSNTLTVTGATTLSNTLAVTGGVTLQNTLGVTGHLQGTTINGSTINASAVVQVGANVVINPAFISVGNPAVNTRITNTSIDTDGTLVVLGATTLSNTLDVTGTTTLANTLSVTGATTLANTLGVTGATTLANTLGVTGATTLSNTLGVTGATTLSGHLQGTTINGSTINASAAVQVGANVVINPAFISVGNPAVNTRITNTSIDTDGTLNVTGATTLLNTLSVTGDAVFAGNLSVQGSLNFTNTTTSNTIVASTVTVGNVVIVPTNISVGNTSTNVVINQTNVMVGANVELNPTFISVGNPIVNTRITNTSIATGGTLNVTGATTLSNTVAITGSTTIQNNLAVDTNVLFVDTVQNEVGINTATPDAALQVVGSANISGSVMIGTNLTAVGNTSLTGISHSISGNVAFDTDTLIVDSVSNRVSVGGVGDATFKVTGTANVTGAVILGSTVSAAGPLNVGANVVVNPTFISVGNPAVNTRITNTAIDTDGLLAVLGTTTLSNTVSIIGAATLANTLAVTGATTLSGHLQGTTINGSTINASAAVQVGANVVINPAFISIGNPTTNTRITNTSIDTDGTLDVTGATTLANTLAVTGATTLANTLAVTGATTLSGHLQGTTINGSTINASAAMQVGANVVVNPTFISIGNPTVNTRITNTGINTGTLTATGHSQLTTINGSTINASAAMQVGANVVINPTFISIGNPTANTQITNTAITTENLTVDNTVTISGSLLVNSAAAGTIFRLTGTGTGNVFVVEDTTNDTTPFVVEGDGRVFIGATSANNDRLSSLAGLNLHANGGTTTFLSAYLSANSSTAGAVAFGRSRALNVGDSGLLSQGDDIVRIVARGDDGVQMIDAAQILIDTDGNAGSAPSVGNMPGRILFSTTPSGSNTLSTRMVIDNQGNVGIGVTNPTTRFQVQGNTIFNGNVTIGSGSHSQVFVGNTTVNSSYITVDSIQINQNANPTALYIPSDDRIVNMDNRGVHVLMTSNGSGTITANRTRYGVVVDMTNTSLPANSSGTGGSALTSYIGGLFFAKNYVPTYVVCGSQSIAQTHYASSSNATSFVIGSLSQSILSSPVTQGHGLFVLARVNANVNVSTLYGQFNLIDTTTAANGAVVTSTIGNYNEVQNLANATFTTINGVQMVVDMQAGTATNGFLFRGVYSGAGTVTNKYGLYLTGEGINYLSSNTGINTATPDAMLAVSGTANVSGAVALGSTLRVNGGLSPIVGIDFSSTGANTDANVLDEYEEGTWTPSWGNVGGASGTMTYFAANTGGIYTKVGRHVYFHGKIHVDTITTYPTGSLRLHGLPFTSMSASPASNVAHVGTFVISESSGFANASHITMLGTIGTGATRVLLNRVSIANTVQNAQMGPTNISPNCYLNFHGFYVASV